MNEPNIPRLMELTKRYSEACFGVQRAMSFAAKCTSRITYTRGGGTVSQVEDGAQLLMEARQKRDAIGRELAQERGKLTATLPKLESDRQRQAVTLRWLKGWPMAKIEVEMGCTRQAIYRLLNRAKKILEEVDTVYTDRR